MSAMADGTIAMFPTGRRQCRTQILIQAKRTTRGLKASHPCFYHMNLYPTLHERRIIITPVKIRPDSAILRKRSSHCPQPVRGWRRFNLAIGNTVGNYRSVLM